MAEVQGRWSRLGFLAALTLVAFVQLDQFARTLRWHGRLRTQYVRTIESALNARLPQIAAALKFGGPLGWPGALALVRDVLPEAEVELFDGKGNRLAAVPRPAPVAHSPAGEQRTAVDAGRMVTVGPVGSDQARLLTYLSLRDGDWDVLLRVAQPVPELVQQVAERRELLLGHGLALLALAVAALLALLPARAPEAPGAPGALDAYAEAMTRLGELGRVQSRQHVAERRKLEERIRVAEPMARAGELTSGIVHEVRNALGTIVGYARLIEQGESAEAGEAASRIREECETLEVFVRRFIEFVKAESLNLGPVDVRRMLSRVAARESGARPGAEVSLAGGPDLAVEGDEELLERAFENLVRNARDAAGTGGHVVLQAARAGQNAMLSVADDGPGLSAVEVGALRPFHTTKAGGLGLGLPLAVKIVKLHGGAMTMEARAPRGLLVTVRLPIGGPGATTDGPASGSFPA
jgi:signal transduction histidine kinase